MSEIEYLEEKIKENTIFLDKWERVLQKDPMDFSAKLQVGNIRAHIDELEGKLIQAQQFAQKEFVEFRFSGGYADWGTMPLGLISKLTGYIDKALTQLALPVSSGKKVRKNEIKEQLGLKMASLSFGSTRLFISANSASNLAGTNLAEETINSFFSILNTSEDPESMARVGEKSSGAVKEVINLLNTLSSSRLEVNVGWSRTKQDSYFWEGKSHKISSLYQVLNEIQREKRPDEIHEGEVYALSQSGRIEIKSKSSGRIKFAYDVTQYEAIRELRMGDRRTFILQPTVVINHATGQEKLTYHLISIS